ncbi:MAG: hypothetical protein V2I43_22450 [Parvularcula sp.]|jgi:hypothetical protein|nr:hypothetical protein [Parvularcula sp.]
MIRRVQVYGQRCSGTNALIKLIETNFPELTFTEEYGFKHWLVPDWVQLPSDVLAIVIAREPGEWLRSLHNKPWHAHPDLKKLPFSEFIRAPWESLWDDDFWGVSPDCDIYNTPIVEERCPSTGKPFANPVAKRTAKLRNWVAVARQAGTYAFATHKTLVENPGAILDQIARSAGVERRADWTFLTSYKGAGEKPFVPTAYEPLSRADRDHVRQYLDESVERQFADHAKLIKLNE